MAAEPLITAAASQAAEELVKEADLGARAPAGTVGAMLALGAECWSIFQVWYASPLPFKKCSRTGSPTATGTPNATPRKNARRLSELCSILSSFIGRAPPRSRRQVR